MTKDLSTGDRVSWNTPQGRTQGTVFATSTRGLGAAEAGQLSDPGGRRPVSAGVPSLDS